MKKNVFFTGYPGVGKTTIIKKMVSEIGNGGGFYTEEIREVGIRVGFKIITLEGKEGILAHKDIPSPYQVGRYGVNIKDLEEIATESILRTIEDGEKKLIVIDEIGKMELFSSRFREVVMMALDDSSKRVLGTIQNQPNPFIEEIKSRKDVKIISVNANNRNSLPQKIWSNLKPRGLYQ